MKKLDDKGNAAILLCLVITGLFGFTALGIDVGLVYIERAKLFSSLDAAALAASLELPNSDDKARTMAVSYLQKNSVNPDDGVITIGSDHKSIEIKANKKVQHLFAPVIGIKSSLVTAKSKAVIGPAKKVSNGIRPFAVEKYNFSYGDLVTLKEGGGAGYHGNYDPVALGGRGSNVFGTNSLYGYNGSISVGDYIDTETGNMAGVSNDIKSYINSEHSTFDNFPRNSIRLWTIPVVDSLLVNGRNQVLVSGFAEFYVEDAGSRSGKIELQGRFVRYVINSAVNTGLSDTGCYGVKLSK